MPWESGVLDARLGSLNNGDNIALGYMYFVWDNESELCNSNSIAHCFFFEEEKKFKEKQKKISYLGKCG